MSIISQHCLDLLLEMKLASRQDDPRRHKARCIHYRDGQCGWKANYSGKCIGSSHCMDYSESLEDFKKLQKSRKTAEQIERDNIDKLL